MCYYSEYMQMTRTDVQPNAQCELCEDVFYAAPSHVAQGWGKYCSRECYGKSKQGEKHPNFQISNVACKGCGTVFHQKPCSIVAGKAKSYCSAKCRQITIGKKEYRCHQCHNTFVAWASQRSHKDAFCSKECASMNTNQKIALICVQCKGDFALKPSMLLRKKGAGSFCSMKCKAAYMSGTQLTTGGINRNTTHRGGKREDMGGQYFRSGWEANYARYLNWLIQNKQLLRWEFEPDTFEFHGIKRGVRFYTPDFKVFELDGTYAYHEVKGWMDAKSATKLKRMAKYYPDETIILIDRPVYTSIAKQMKGIIPNWE